MLRFSSKTALALAFLGLAGCGAAPAPSPANGANAMAPRERLGRIVDRYWDERVTPGNPLSAQFMADSLALERRYLDEVMAVPRAGLDADSQLTYDIFRRQRELAIEGFIYPSELLPVNPFGGMPLEFARLAADAGQPPLWTAKDYGVWLLRIDDYVGWTRQAIANMREGKRRGYTSPRVLMQRMLPLLHDLGEDTAANVFYIPQRNMPATIENTERTRLTSNLGMAIKDKLLPAYRELHDFLQNEYLPAARTTVALSALPLGPSWYAYRIELAGGKKMTANEVHSIGLAEVERIRVRLQALPAAPASAPATAAPPAAASPAAASPGPASPAPATLAAPATADSDLLNAYRELKEHTAAAMPILFSTAPIADFEIRAMGSWHEGAPLAYQRAPADGRAPAILFVNTASGGARPAAVEIASFLQEAIPGLHYQSALQQERTELPKFRRFGSEPAFSDGWALYAASLGEELGLYRDEAAKRGALSGQLQCAAALVVDTGLHARDWTRAQAVDYLRAQLAADEAAAAVMADRFVALPGAALACKLGELRFQALRSRAQSALGAHFDIREFHSEILKDGAMPLDILEAKMQLWIDAPR